VASKRSAAKRIKDADSISFFLGAIMQSILHSEGVFRRFRCRCVCDTRRCHSDLLLRLATDAAAECGDGREDSGRFHLRIQSEIKVKVVKKPTMNTMIIAKATAAAAM
jgi:hypothetical protein